MFKCVFIMVMIALGLGGCGFKPLYAPNDTADRADRPQAFELKISGTSANGYAAYKLRRELEVYLPTIEQKVPRPLLVSIVVSEAYGDVALNANAKVLRTQGQLYATINVIDILAQEKRQSIDSLLKKSAQSIGAKKNKTFEDNFGNANHPANHDEILSAIKSDDVEAEASDESMRILLKTRLEAVTSYTVNDVEEFSIMSAEAGAREKLIKSLARDIAHELRMLRA